jgi:DNA-directed RNA polymerase subunit beta
VNTRQSGDYTLAPREQVDLIDVSPKQLVSVAASLIPFLENDDANRALMGSNMQRRPCRSSRPRRRSSAPASRRSWRATPGAAIMARRAGVIDQVDATRIVVRATEDLELGDAGWTSTGCASSSAPTRTPASTSARS